MMRVGFVRAAVMLWGLVLMGMGVAAWIEPTRFGGALGLSGAPGLGMATLRADLGAFFIGGGVLALAAGARRAPRLLTAPVLLIGLTLFGRFMALALTPFDRAMVAPMVAEALMLAAFASARLMDAE